MTIVCNIGGTNTLAAALDGAEIGPTRAWRTADFADARALVTTLLDAFPARRIALAVAGPVFAGGRARLTNGDLKFDAEAMRAAHGLEEVILLNDIVSVAWSLRPETAEPGDTLALNVGTGFGGALLTGGEVPAVVPLEPGRISSLSLCDTGPDVFELEDVLSGGGLARLHAHLGGDPVAPAEVLRAAAEGDSAAQRTVETFWRVLGHAAAELSLLLPATARLVLTGGVVRKNRASLAAGPMREVFETRRRLAARDAGPELCLVTDAGAELRGLANAITRSARFSAPSRVEAI